MGAIVLPASGPVYVDSSAVIYAVEKVSAYDALLALVWTAAKAGQFRSVTSDLTWLEVLAIPFRDGNLRLGSLVRAFLTAREVALATATLAIWSRLPGCEARA